MRISKLRIQNFRQLKDVQINFPKNSTHDLHFFIGQNGAGKTNIMNVINWCLYEKEPHLSKDSTTLPLLNLKTINTSQNNELHNVEVELWVQTENNKIIVFERKEIYRVFAGQGVKPRSEGTSFQVRTEDKDNNTEIIVGEEADNYVNRFVPKNIKEFFFFDGERLDKYFINESGEKINHATFEISQIHLLKIVQDRLTILSKELSREAGKTNPKLDEKNDKIEKEENSLKTLCTQIDEIKVQIGKSKEIVKECQEYLQGFPDIEAIEKRREIIVEVVKDKSITLKEKIMKRQEVMSEFSKLVNLENVISSTLKLIQEKRINNELPPNIDPNMLKEIIFNNFCNTCQRVLDDNSREKVTKMLTEYTLSTKVATELLAIEMPLQMLHSKIKESKKEVDDTSKDVNGLDIDIGKLDKEKNEIDKKLGGYTDVETIKNKHNDRKTHEDLLEDNNRRLGQLQGAYEKGKGELIDAIEDRDKELKKDEKHKKINIQHQFCNSALKVISDSSVVVMDEIRKKIELETKETFFKLIWKKNTYKDIIIDDKYNISLIHQMGYDSLGTASAAERELLALSFTLALHNVSGFDSPLIIDTPVARVSDTNRENFAKVLLEVSKGKQTILLFTPDEYSDNVKDVIDKLASNKFRYSPATDELETSIGVL